MSKFVLNKPIDSIRSNSPRDKKWFELTSLEKGEFSLFEHLGGSVAEVCTLTKEEWRTVWIMLTANE